MRIVVWSVSLNGRRLRGRERERETLPRQRYGSQVVYITRSETRQTSHLRGGYNLEINLAWQALSDVMGGGGWGGGWGRCSPAPDRRAGWLTVIIQWLGRSVSSYHLSPIMSAAKLLLQASPYNLSENFACLVVVIVTNVESNFWIKLIKTLELTLLMIFRGTTGCYISPQSSVGSRGWRGWRLFRSRLRTQLNIPAPLHRGCAGVEQPLYPAEPTPPKVLKYIIVMRPGGPQTWLADNFFPSTNIWRLTRDLLSGMEI